MPLPQAARWAALRPRIDALLTLPPLQRTRALEALAANDPDTAWQLQQLLKSRDEALQTAASPLLDEPVLAGSAPAWRPGMRLAHPPPIAAPRRASVPPSAAAPTAEPPVLSETATALPRPPSAQRARAGDVIGRWILIAPLGEDSGSGLWRVHSTRNEPAPANSPSKAMAPEWVMRLWHRPSTDAVARSRWHEQGQKLLAWQHPRAAQLLDVDLSPSGQPYLVLERLHGERIDHWCNAHDRGLRERVQLFLSLLAVIADAHAHLQLHLDLHPSQVVIDDQGQLRVASVGMALLLGPAAPRPNPEYAAPEHYHGALPCVSADIYSLGVMLYELLTHQHPIGQPEATPREYLRAAAAGRFLPASQARPGLRRSLGPDMDAILARTLDPLPSQRYASVAGLAQDLQHWLRNEAVAASGPALLAEPAPEPDLSATQPWLRLMRLRWAQAQQRLRRRPWLSGGLGALLLLSSAGLGASLLQIRETRLQAQQTAQALTLAQREAQHAWAEYAAAQDMDMLHRLLMEQLSSARQLATPPAPGALIRQVALQLQNATGLDGPRRVALMTALGEAGASGLTPAGDPDTLAVMQQAYTASLSLNLPALRARAACALGAAMGAAGQQAAGLQLARQALIELPEPGAFGDAPSGTPGSRAEAGLAASRVVCLLRSVDLIQQDTRGNTTGLPEAQAALQWLPLVPSPRDALETEATRYLAEASGRAGQVGEALRLYEQLASQVRGRGLSRSDSGAQAHAGVARWSGWAGRPLMTESEIEQWAAAPGAAGSAARAERAWLLANAMIQRAQWSAALQAAEQARQLAQTTGDGPRQRQALVLQLQALRGLQAHAQALALLPSARVLQARAGPTEAGTEAALRMVAAQLAEDQGSLSLARQLTDEAVAGASAHPSGTLALPQLLLQRAAFHERQGELNSAFDDAGRALALWSQQLGPTVHSAYVGQALLLQSRVQVRRGDKPGAQAKAATALLHLERSLGAEDPRSQAALRASGALANERPSGDGSEYQPASESSHPLDLQPLALHQGLMAAHIVRHAVP